MINELLNKYKDQQPKTFGDNHIEKSYPASAVISMLEEQKDTKAAFLELFDKAACIQHWHCWGKNDEGMVVNSEKVRELWEVLEKYKSFRHSIETLPI
jgi:hypothetical protein